MAIIPFLAGCKTAGAETIIQDDAEIISSDEEKKLQGLCDKILKERSEERRVGKECRL